MGNLALVQLINFPSTADSTIGEVYDVFSHSDLSKSSFFRPVFFNPPYPQSRFVKDIHGEYELLRRIPIDLRRTEFAKIMGGDPKFDFKSVLTEIIGIGSGMAISIIGIVYSILIGNMAGATILGGPLLAGLLGVGIIYAREKRKRDLGKAIYKIS